MDNDKWLCTAEIFQKPDGSTDLKLSGPEDADQAEMIKTFILVAEALKIGVADSRLDVLPTDPKTT